MRYLVILFLFLCEFTFGQIPGFPKFIGTRNFPTVYTLSYTLAADANSADVTAQVINTGSLINETGSPTPTTLVSGILWGNAPPTITDGVSSKTTDGTIDGQPFTTTISNFPEEGTIYIVAYATTATGTYYGKVLTIAQDVVRSPYTNKIWMDRNLGATALPQSATAPSSLDSTSMGGLYQWGRKSDGHQIVLPRTFVSGTTYNFYSGTNSVRQSNWAVVSDKFYTNLSGGSPTNDWLTLSRNSLWQGGLNGENNPCPAGFRVPTVTEFTNETNNFTLQSMNGAFTSFLRLPATGYRNYDGTQGTYAGYNHGRYWTSSINGTGSYYLLFNTLPTAYISSTGTATGRIMGYAVRCIKGEESSGGSAVISGFTEGSSTGYLKLGEPVSVATKTIFANVTTAGTYSINTLSVNSNGVVYTARGTLAVGNNRSITLTATGTPTSQNTDGNWPYYLNTVPNFGFNEPILNEPSTNGNAIVSGYTSISSSGTIVESIEVSNTTQTIRANVTKTGSYFLKTTTNSGITFSANGTFTSLGNNDITLVATGTPISAGNYTFTLNTSSPSFAFNRIIGNQSSGGSAIITWQGVSQSGLTTAESTENSRAVVRLTEASTYSPPFVQYVAVNVTQIGTYNIDAPGNRNFQGNTLRLVGSGTFTTTGVQTIPLYVYGAAIIYTGNPTVPHYFYLPRENYSPSYYVIRNSQ
jgi:hypothetical protein